MDDEVPGQALTFRNREPNRHPRVAFLLVPTGRRSIGAGTNNILFFDRVRVLLVNFLERSNEDSYVFQ